MDHAGVDDSSSILVSRGLATLRGFALSNTLLAIDYEGALAPIADAADSTRMRGSIRRLLARVTELYPTIVMSRSALSDVTTQLLQGQGEMDPLLRVLVSARDERRGRGAARAG